MSVFRLSAAVLLLAAAPVAAQMMKPLGAQWIDAVKEEDGTKLNKIASDRSKLNAAVLDYQSDGEGAIHIAVKKGNDLYLRFMLQLGANPNLIAEKTGETPLTMAVISDQPAAFDVLLTRARVDQANRAGETPLIKAVLFNRPDLVRALLAKGADPDKADYTGKSARTYAAGGGRSSVISKMLAEAPKRSVKPVAGPRIN
jgi:ankyrin repeat protein